MIRFYLVFGWLLISMSALAQPCVRIVNTDIPDNGNFYTSRIEASTATSGNQILCGVRLSFTHQFVNELRFVLQSPSGKRLVLIAGKTGSSKTGGSTFDVLFVRGEDTAHPDDFKKPVWQDNKWEEKQSYVGSYYPDGEAGLEHFDGERVTGTWNLIFADLVNGGSGVLESFELIFCDPPVFCNPCSIPRDFVVNQDFGSFCGGEAQLSNIRPAFKSANLTPGYENTFLVVNQGNRIVARGPVPDFSNLPRGTYTIVGLQYRAANASVIEGINNLNNLNDRFYGIQATLCGATSNSSAKITILSNPGYQEQTMEVYGRDYVVIGGQRITSDQIVNQEFTDINGCDSLVRTRVEFKEYTPVFTQDNQYDCNHTSITVSVTTDQNFEVQRWFTRDGRISNQSDLGSPQIMVNSPGTYFVVFKIQDYLDTVAYELDVDPGSPVITLSNEYSLCSATPLTVQIGSNYVQATVNPASSATITGNTLTIHEPDLYTIMVSNGECTLTKHILVKPPEPGEQVNIEDAVLSCPGIPVEITPDLSRDYENYTWYREGTEVANTRVLSTTTPGLYTFRAYDGNQCGSTGTVWVEDNTVSVDLQIEGPSLINCSNQGEDNRLTASFLGDFEVKWTLPDGSERMDQSISVTGDGTYAVEITDGTGCVISESTTITTDLTKIDFDVPAEVLIPCDVPFARLLADVSAAPADYSIVWDGASSGAPATNAIVDQPGTVRVTVEHLISHCQTIKTINVTEETGKPKLDIGDVPTAITCEDPIRRIPLSITDCADCDITPNYVGDIELRNDTLIAREPGTAYIKLDNGSCVSEHEIHFPDQTMATPLDLEVRNIGCSNTNGSILIRNASAYRSIQFQSDTDTFEYSANRTRDINNPVTYTVVYIDKASGCVGRQTVEVKLADQTPNVDFDPVQYLDCATGIATLRVRGTGIERIVWTHPDGQVTEPQDKFIVVREAGTYTFVVLNANNCYVEGAIEVRDDRSTPTVGLDAEYTIPCSDEDGLIRMSFDTSTLASTEWYGPDGLVVNAFHPMLGPGSYQVIIEGKNGCRSTEETTIVQESVGTGPDIIAPPITCLRDFSRVHLSNYEEVAQVQWIDESGQASVSDSFDVFNPGRISLVIKQLNGCLNTRTLIVEEDTEVVPFTINKPIINCHNLDPVLRVQTPDSITRSIEYQWYIADIPIGTEASYDIQYPGDYRVVVAFDNGCVDSAMHTVELDTSAVEWLLENDTITCARSKIQLSNKIPVDHIESANWIGPGGFTSKAKRPNFQTPGVYTVTYEGKNGCQAEAEMEIYDDQYTPQLDSVGFLSLGCEGKAVDLTYFTRDSVTTQYWLVPSGETLEDSVVQITSKGNYLLYLEGDNGCSKIDTFFIDHTVSPNIELEVEAAGCDDQMGQAIVFPGLDTFETIWYEPGTMTELGRGHQSPQLPVGSYLVTVINPYNNCDTTTVVDVVDISSVMHVELSIDDSLRCERSEANLIANVFPPSTHYVYEWRYGSGDPISTDTIAAGITREGEYSFTARDTVNQCVVDSVYRNVRAPSRLRHFDLFLTEPACNINRSGYAIMDSIIGASNMDLMTYSVNGAPFRDQDTFPFLYANETYHINAKDQYGCTVDTTLFPQLRGIMDRVSAIADTTINSGDSLDFNHPDFKIEYVSTDAPLSEQYTWILNPDTLFCDYDCVDQIQHQFFQTRNVTAILTNEYGCTVTDTFNIYVREGDVLNVPNAIAPASSTVGSAHACIYTNQYVENIEVYIIFNRRGNVVFKQTNFTPQNPHQQLSFCWDGRDRQNNIHPPGNYNYYVKYKTVYGQVKEKYGNILLIR